jgi:hypothetical protein
MEKGFPAALLFYMATNDHKSSSSEQQTFVVFQFWKLKTEKPAESCAPH